MRRALCEGLRELWRQRAEQSSSANGLGWSVLGGLGRGVFADQEDGRWPAPAGLELSESGWRVRSGQEDAGEGGGPFSNCLWPGAVLCILDPSQTDTFVSVCGGCSNRRGPYRFPTTSSHSTFSSGCVLGQEAITLIQVGDDGLWRLGVFYRRASRLAGGLHGGGGHGWGSRERSCRLSKGCSCCRPFVQLTRGWP